MRLGFKTIFSAYLCVGLIIDWNLPSRGFCPHEYWKSESQIHAAVCCIQF